MHIFILTLLLSRAVLLASTGVRKGAKAAFSMQFSVNMRQDMVPAESEPATCARTPHVFVPSSSMEINGVISSSGLMDQKESRFTRVYSALAMFES